MKVCLICVEIFAWGKYGGFGRATRIIGRELAKRGVEVSAVVPRRRGQRPIEQLDGITVYSFPAYRPLAAIDLFKQCQADLYHSQEPSLSTYLAMRAMPRKKHLITCRDPRTFQDRMVEMRQPSVHWGRTLLSSIYEDNVLVRRAVRQVDGLFCCADSLAPKVRQLYGLPSDPGLLASPVQLPDRPMRKSATPIVCFIARLDRRKRPELFFELARSFPDVRFIALGQSQDAKWDWSLRERYRDLPNVEMIGFVDQFASGVLSDVLEKSWVLVNTASREGLPTSFLEALAHRCAVLSHVNPDGIAERFGYHAQHDDFAEGLTRLLEGQVWKTKGERGYRYVQERYELNTVIDQHLAVYQTTLNGHARTPSMKKEAAT